MSRNHLYLAAALLPLLGLAGCSKAPADVTVDQARLALFKPLPEAMAPKDATLDDNQIALGRQLYYDARFSRDQKHSCNSCHDLAKYGVDGTPTSEGFKGQHGDRNAPTVYHAAGHFVQFWDGRAKDVEEQAKGPVLNPVEMAMPSDKEVLAVINSIPEYQAAFKKAFPADKDPVNYDNFGKAIGAFERKLLTPARWDKFLKGDQTALTNDEKAGLNAFLSAGCQTCHAGAYLGGNMYQKTGAAKPWPSTADPGRAKVTKSEADQMMFKVPSLRDIDKTAPYFHDGSTKALPEAIAKMAEFQLGKTLSAAEIQSIEAFLKSLTGDLPVDYIKVPELPKSTAKTPKPSEAD